MTEDDKFRIELHRSDVYYGDPLAADLIEQLERERDEARHLQSCACNYDTPTDVCMGHHALFKRLYAVERGKLEAKLAHAVEALQEIINHWDAPTWKDALHQARATGSVINRARTVLAKLEGKDE